MKMPRAMSLQAMPVRPLRRAGFTDWLLQHLAAKAGAG